MMLLLSLFALVTCQSNLSFSTPHSWGSGIFFVALGLLLALAGSKLVKPAIFLSGSTLFAGIMYVLLTRIEPTGGYANRDSVILFSCLAVGLLGGLIAYFVYRAGLAFLGALGGASFAFFIITWKSDMFSSLTVLAIFITAFAVIGAAAIQFIEKPATIFLTAFAGSYILFLGIDVFAATGFTRTAKFIMSGTSNADSFNDLVKDVKWLYLMLGGVLLFSLLAVIVQLRLNGKKISFGKKKADKKKTADPEAGKTEPQKEAKKADAKPKKETKKAEAKPKAEVEVPKVYL
jgi:hypothetical protein